MQAAYSTQNLHRRSVTIGRKVQAASSVKGSSLFYLPILPKDGMRLFFIIFII
jgi:hypothetical protein